MGSGLAGSHVPVGRPPVHGAASAGMSMAAEVRPPPGVPSREPTQCSLLYFSPGTIPHVPRDVIGPGQIASGSSSAQQADQSPA
jgi:hypothetical protein